MEIVFRTTKMRRCYEESGLAIQTWGPDVGRRYINRITTLYGMRRSSEVFQLRSWRTHALKGPLAGRHAINLTGRWRLIVTLGDGVITVEEVSNHYD